MIKEPESMDECAYYTIRDLKDEDGNINGEITAWVLRGECPNCGKAKMGKPRDPKTGKAKIRAKEYICPECEHVIEKEAYEETLQMQGKYKCPHCDHEGEIEVPFIMKNVQRFNPEKGKKVAVKSVRFQCEKCKGNIDVTKKMK
ncbi:hypothetical protein ACFL1H_07265 [Nanoarchaeota archaeon]